MSILHSCDNVTLTLMHDQCQGRLAMLARNRKASERTSISHVHTEQNVTTPWGAIYECCKARKNANVAVASAHPVMPLCMRHMANLARNLPMRFSSASLKSPNTNGSGAHRAVIEDHLAEIIVKAPRRPKYHGFRGPRKADDRTVNTPESQCIILSLQLHLIVGELHNSTLKCA